ncbi:riboflavin kinase [Myotisia sp. PD_48]|nr:riboflavin kinase [Myotisia sp. PD_48]
MRPDGPRDTYAGPDTGPESPFPIRLSGPVIKGFGRGSKELGVPTANIPADRLSEYPDLESGVYYGAVALDPKQFKHTRTDGESADSGCQDPDIFPCVMSIGYNPYYKNTVRSVEIHILPHLSMESSPTPGPATPIASSSELDEPPRHRPRFHHFPDFYGTPLNLLILGYIRPEYDYVSLEALIDDIRIDCDVARRSLARKTYAAYLDDDVPEGDGEKVKSERGWLRAF